MLSVWKKPGVTRGSSKVRLSNLLGMLTLASAIAVAGFAGSDTAQAAETLLECKQAEPAGTSSVVCDFRLSENKAMQDLIVSVDGQVSEDAVFSPFSNTDLTSAWLFVIDRTNPRRAAAVQRSVDLVRQQLQNISAQRMIGVATFANDLDIVLPIATSHDNQEEALGAIRADGLATEYFSSTLDAILALSDVEADRKAVVIFSDGKSEDTAYSLNDVARAAREANVTIIGIGMADNEIETPPLQKIERLTEETGGAYTAVIGEEPFNPGFTNNLFRHLENGGLITIPVAEPGETTSISIEISTSGNETFSATREIALAVPPPEPAPEVEPQIELVPPPKTLSAIAKVYSVFGDDAASWADENQGLAWLLLLLGVLALVAIAYLFLQQNKKPANESAIGGENSPSSGEPSTPGDIDLEPEHGTTDIPFEEEPETYALDAPPQESFGHFEIVGNDATKFNIESKSVSIGRHSDNDLVLNDLSVHRHHAHLYVGDNNTVTINDLGNKNGVLVNGKRIEKATLEEGDMVELGEVRLRFFP